MTMPVLELVDSRQEAADPLAGLTIDQQNDVLQKMPEAQLLALGLPRINAYRAGFDLKPIDSWPIEATSGEWNSCLIGCSLGGHGSAAALACKHDPVLSEIEMRFEDCDLDAVTTCLDA